MKRLRKFENFDFGLSRIGNYLNDLLKKGGTIAKDVWTSTKVESKETKLALEILSRMISGKEVTDGEKKFLKAQSKDIAKILPLVAIQGIPIPIPITPLLIMLGKKYGVDILPKDHRSLLDDKNGKTKSD